MPKAAGARKVSKTAPTRPSKKAKLRALQKQVEEHLDMLLKEGGVDDLSETIEDGARWFVTDDAAAFAYVEIDDDVVVLHVVSELMPVPSDRDLNLALMRELLELNSHAFGAGRFSIRGADVYVSASDDAEDLSLDQIRRQVHSVLTVAAVMGPRLQKRFTRTRRKRARGVRGN
jgi:hypothetical protein